MKLFAIWIFFLSAWAYAECQEGKIVLASSNNIYPAEISDHVGFCQHHAARDLLHQEICKAAHNPNDCFQPSVLDFLAVDASLTGEEVANRNSPYALQEILRRREIAAENCLSLNSMFNVQHNDYLDYGEKFSAAVHDVVLKECMEQRSASDATQAALLAKCTQELQSEKQSIYFYAAIKKRAFEKNCTPKAIPRFASRRSALNENGNSSEEVLNKLLSRGHQVRAVTQSPHALVVSNFRHICIQGKVRLQYQVLDSLYGSKRAAAKTRDDWIDGDSFIKTLNPKSTFAYLETLPPKNGPVIHESQNSSSKQRTH